MPTSNADLYAILGVERSASADEIKRAFRRLARQHHPDVSSDPEAEARFKEVALAYEILSDPGKRQQYDTFGTTGSSAGSDSGFSGFGNLNDIFDFFFSGGGFGGGTSGQRRRGYEPGADIQRATHLTLLDCLNGKRLELQIEREEVCGTCNGSRSEPGSQPIACTTCGGHGMVTQLRDTILGRVSTTVACPTCRGEGMQVTDPCKACHGRGVQVQRRMIEVNVPPGVEGGMTLRVAGEGHSGRGGAPSGDLLVHMTVEPDKRFERHGADLLARVPVQFADLALGATVEVSTLTASEKLRIPAGTESGHRFVLRGEGLPRLRGSGRGTLVVEAVVDVPHKLTRRERELLEELRGTAKKPGDGAALRSPFRKKSKG